MWQTKDLQKSVFGSVAMIRVSIDFFGSVANTGLSTDPSGSNTKDLWSVLPEANCS